MKFLFLALTILLSQNAFSADCKNYSKYTVVSKTELQKIVENKTAFIVDVNSEDSYKKSHVPGAVHFDAIEKNFAANLPADKNAEIVAYCGSTKCSAWQKAAEMACQLGYTNIKHFKEGIAGWNKKS
jgi:rhodanese-related sulfurtransferase